MKEQKKEEKFQITIKLKVKGDRELILSMDDAKELYETLSDIFQKEKEYISYPVYPPYYWRWTDPYTDPYPYKPFWSIYGDNTSYKVENKSESSSYTISMNNATLE